MSAALRQRVLIGVAAGLAAWSAWSVFKPGEAPVADAAKRARHVAGAPAAPTAGAVVRTATPVPAAAQALTLRDTINVAASRNPFDANPWVVKREPPKAASAVPAPPPVIEVKAPAPPPPSPPLQLPYRFLGTYAEKSDSPSVFLALGERLIVAKAGDALDGGFRLEAVSPRELTFVHIQQNVTLRLSVTGGPI
jgi:hypothetical protein